MHRFLLGVVLLCGFQVVVSAEEFPPIERLLPPQGIEIPAEVQERLTQATDALRGRLAAVKKTQARGLPNTLWADVEVYLKAVDYAVKHREFYGPKDFEKADRALKSAETRLGELESRKSPWTSATGLVVRGFPSRIDGSVQPYGLVIPENLSLASDAPRVPLYIFLHGRGDKATDLHFIEDREKKAGEVQPAGAIVLHPFGRQCVGYKSAGEIDVLEAVEHVKQNYPIDSNRIVLMGFSMGGAGAWHLGAHYAPHWRVVAPGAGFAETARYTNTKPETVPDYERLLWGCYDVPAYVRNLFNLRTIAYSGELDKQIQAARVMEEAFAVEGQKLDHRIGPNVPHKYEPETLKQLLKDIAAEIEKPRSAETEYWQSRTLRYNRMPIGRLVIQGLEEHWQDSRVTTSMKGKVVETKNVRCFQIHPPYPSGNAIQVDGQTIKFQSDEDLPRTVTKIDGKWQVSHPSEQGLWKLPKLQGPIDDAFLDSFLIVLPTGKPSHPDAQAVRWTAAEAQHFQDRWRALMRGEARVKKDVDVTAEDIMQHNLILWGDVDTNAILKKFADRLPVKYSAEEFELGGQKYSRQTHVPVLIYPNPEMPNKYIVLNSGLTFREAHDKTNSQQNPKLPDWAVLDITSPPTASAAGKVVAADFFDEQWRVKQK